MWATCCNWFCLDGQPEEAPPAQGARTQAYSNPGYSSFPSPTGSEPGCKACGAHFANMARKQQTCLDCKKNFCMTCSTQVGNGPRLCLLCQRVRATAFQREELMKMKVKDLRDYLSLHDVSTEMCREKEELVLLVLGQQPVISQEGRTRAPTLSPDFPEHQAFRTQPRASTVPPTSARLPSSPAQATSVSPAQAQESQQANGHVSQDQEEPVYLESTARAPAEEETQSVDSEDSFVPGRRASLSDLTDLEDIEGLTVRQLKEILARNFVNYKGCCEKWELMERVTRLYKDQKGLQHLEPGFALKSSWTESVAFPTSCHPAITASTTAMLFSTAGRRGSEPMCVVLKTKTVEQCRPAWRRTCAGSAWTRPLTVSCWSAVTWSPAPSVASA
ncbi:E3 ubiquitin-protein ligase rififylin isoform X4 [Lutra lutra]|nr:E3 ubiquitin-protein ligase rififylin isoform X4 [Lutra lutra]XP_047562075.1 E3 ubiquitin-protein ligase rififylin isoform X4 [Lutra lutra]XP_047562076.1 E3 ubiquitin-protein ligase rififylin isoform X4 [Lutra lutra]XP_047562077.1 E3 ubiquitin-protein ligase rififylin isoform X4 [Lutra lutra]XP_047562078.1 E3 ubiquitin-protein ligase rififylin isoform X4 [Lutra lutra]XP_047562079.1 E3 ubiquitin-protein ligase rififylin isoform X4 [Lutra lutra]XP_047562081.1 E3 ubiquitin-protein ligase rifi